MKKDITNILICFLLSDCKQDNHFVDGLFLMRNFIYNLVIFMKQSIVISIPIIDIFVYIIHIFLEEVKVCVAMIHGRHLVRQRTKYSSTCLIMTYQNFIDTRPTLARCVGRQALISCHYLHRSIACDIWPILDTSYLRWGHARERHAIAFVGKTLITLCCIRRYNVPKQVGIRTIPTYSGIPLIICFIM